MTPEERSLIETLFERLRANAAAPRDREADALIAGEMARSAGAAYLLVQTLLLQDQALQAAHEKLRELEQAGQPASFLSPQRGAAPAAGSAGPWGSAPRTAGSPFGGPPAPQTPYRDPWQQAPQPATPPGATGPLPGTGAGGFLRQAASMAAGVAGGALLMDGMRALLGGGHLGGFGGTGLGGFGNAGFGMPGLGGPQVIEENVYVLNDAPRQDGDRQGDGLVDAGYQDDNLGPDDGADGSDFGDEEWA